MATKRYILYVEEVQQAQVIIDKSIRIQTHIQEIGKLDGVPEWLSELPLPVFVDKMKKEAYYGENTLKEYFSKKPKAVILQDDD